MRSRHRNSLVVVLAASLFTASLQSAAHAGVICTQQYLTAVDREATLQRIDAVLAREEVRSRLEQYGVDPVAADARIAALTDQELSCSPRSSRTCRPAAVCSPSSASSLIVLLILELVGVIDIFNKI